ncbi:FAD:protein FMN transferase [Solirubrobacter soli]|uniref:FAD:protein FMN transferase n=1 Tax=Solirubrobacter soli TaxID=363832 RepID=UPI0004241678|nr:FAD:protein FMN transferase [Solirubrobacter soli]
MVAISSRDVRVERVMGTVVSLDMRAGSHEGVADAMQWLHEADRRFSTYRADSDIARLERGELLPCDADDDVRWVLDRCAALREETGGFFDIRATGRLDPSALVKGWATQRAADILDAGGLTDYCLTVGGDVIARGGPWRVGIQHPLDRDAIAARVLAGDLAIATSGTYERGEHIRAPHGTPTGVLSVTVTGPDLGTADAYSTAAFAMGIAGPQWTLGLVGYEALTILADGTVLQTPGFPLLEDDE